MFKFYYVNEKPDNKGDHEVHIEDCSYMPSVVNRKYLGLFESCSDAVEEARKTFTRTNGCFWCSKKCHTT